MRQLRPAHLNVADLGPVVNRPDLGDNGHRLEIAGQIQAETGSRNLQGDGFGSRHVSVTPFMNK